MSSISGIVKKTTESHSTVAQPVVASRNAGFPFRSPWYLRYFPENSPCSALEGQIAQARFELALGVRHLSKERLEFLQGLINEAEYKLLLNLDEL